MSTRAIIALKTKDGYETCWNWNDGGPDSLGRELRRHFTDEKIVRELVKIKSFSIIDNKKTIFEFMRTGDSAVALTNNRYVLKHSHQGDVVAGEGENAMFYYIQDMLDQDINYVYVFDPEVGKWKTYK